MDRDQSPDRGAVPPRLDARLAAAVFLVGMSAVLTLYPTQPLLVPIGQWAGESPEHAAWSVSATTLGVACTAPVAGAFSDRRGRKSVILGALLALIVATLACMAAPTFWILLTFRLLQGVATPFVFAVAVAYIGEEFPRGYGVRINGIYLAGTAFGGFSGRFFSGVVAGLTGNWRLGFAPVVLLLAVAAAAAWAWLPRERAFTPAESVAAGMRGVGVHLRDWRILATCGVGASLLFQQVGLFTYGSLQLQKPPMSLGTVEVGFVFVVMLAPTVVTPLVSKLINGRGRTFAFACSSAMGLAGLACTWVPHVWAVVLGLAMSCTALLAGQSCATGFVAQHARTARSAAVGLYLTSYYLGGTLGGVVPAPVYVGAGWGWTLVLIAAVTAVAAGPGLLAWRRPGPARTQPNVSA